MKLPRDVSGADLAKALTKLGYSITRQRSSHIRMTTQLNGQHHITVPIHDSIKSGHWRAYSRMLPTTMA